MGESEGRREGKAERKEGRRERGGESENWQSAEGKDRRGPNIIEESEKKGERVPAKETDKEGEGVRM